MTYTTSLKVDEVTIRPDCIKIGGFYSTGNYCNFFVPPGSEIPAMGETLTVTIQREAK